MASDFPSNAAQAAGVVSESVAQALSDPNSSLIANMSAAQDVLAAQDHYGWLGFFGRLILFLLHITTTILYWIVRIATIGIPTFLYALFSTSWTITMNATTLFVPPVYWISGASILTISPVCSLWLVSSQL